MIRKLLNLIEEVEQLKKDIVLLKFEIESLKQEKKEKYFIG